MSSQSAPDMSGQNAAAVQQAQLSKEQLDWAKQIYAETAPDRAEATARANEISDQQLSDMRKQSGLTDEHAAFYRETYKPIEQRLAGEAEGYDTAARREAASGDAMAGVGQQFDVARASAAREAAARGVDPSSGNFAASMGTMGATEAATKAAAGNTAAKQVETMGYARRMDAAGLGRGTVANQATSAGIALNQGNSSVGNSKAVGEIQAQGNTIMNQGYSGAQNGLAGASQSYGNIASIQQKSSDQSALYGALGSVAGAGINKWSDVNMKENIEPVNPDEALEAVEKTPVSNWAYKNGAVPGDSGEKHTGPMAQDVHKTMGKKASPTGKEIDLVSMNGITMAAIQGLSKKVDKIMAAQGLPMAA